MKEASLLRFLNIFNFIFYFHLTLFSKYYILLLQLLLLLLLSAVVAATAAVTVADTTSTRSAHSREERIKSLTCDPHDVPTSRVRIPV